MNRLRQFCAATVLTFLLTCSLFAGDMATGYIQPPPPENSAVAGDMATGLTATDDITEAETAYIDPATGLALKILQSLLLLF